MARTSARKTSAAVPSAAPAQAPQAVTVTRRARTAKVPVGETRDAKFSRLAQMRTTNAIRAIRLIGQLSAPNYAWDASQVQQIGSELDKALSDTLAKFRRSSHGPKAESLFRLVQTPTQQQAA